ncbi:glycosyltransferase 87 family protein [Devosia sp.]|uniref:glycosyltransferase 87 family protein n=1 Tax=Devosia sp. TaxID=1871048 RepID=UPI0032677D60
MTGPHRTLRLSLLAVCVLFLGFFCKAKFAETLGISGMLYANGTPVGGDFINLWSVAQLVLSGHSGQIYDSAAFMAFERTLTGGDLGLRLWAYPPHSLLAAWPFGLLGFYPALAAWSLLSLVVLWFGARRFGFERLEAAIIVLSPASVLSLYYGQTGNLAAGLLLFALSVRGPGAAIAASLLSFKPQTGVPAAGTVAVPAPLVGDCRNCRADHGLGRGCLPAVRDWRMARLSGRYAAVAGSA